MNKVIEFMRYRKAAAALSITLILISIGSFAINGMSLGLDFTSGTQVELEYESTADISGIRTHLKGMGYENVVVTNFGSDREVSIRIQTEDANAGDEVAKSLDAATDEQVQVKRISFVGPQIGEELRDDGGIGMIFALLVVMVYVAVRFQIKFSVGAVVALAHDVIIVLGLFSILQIDFDLTVLAAVLAVIGYSLNDTIVVCDRIRENFRMVRKGTPEEIVNISLSQTLSRTLITSLTTLLVLFALFIVGGEVINSFALALIVGVGVGTYSSIYVAANVLLAMNVTKEDLMPVEKEGEDQEEIMP